MVSGKPVLSVAIPCYNEEDALPLTIPPLVEEMKTLDVEYEIVLVNNGSQDRTAEIIDGFTRAGLPVRRVDVQINQGVGLGATTGIKACVGEIICFMCADGQVGDKEVVQACRVALDSPPGTLVKVQRITRGDGAFRKFISFVYNSLFRLFFKGITPDVNACPKILRAEEWALLDIKSKDSFIDPEIMIKAASLSYKIVEIPVEFLERPGGSSKVRLFHAVYKFVEGFFKYRFGSELRKWKAQNERKPQN